MAASSGGGGGGGRQRNATDSIKEIMQNQSKPIRSMRLFTEWDVENAAPNCIPRSCCMRVTRLQVFNALESELKAMVICVAMQGSRRSLRSDQIPVQPSGTIDVALDLVFTLQYPHFLKRRENRLQVMLQRRKKYKNRTILGYKNLAVGNVNMAQVLQGWCSKDLQLQLYTKGDKFPVATLTISSLTCEPIERDLQVRQLNLAENQESTDEDADDDSYSSELEDSGGEMDSARESYSRHPSRSQKAQSRNLKQKFVRTFFKKLRVSEEELGAVQTELQEELNEDYDIGEDALYFEDFNDSENDDDLLDDNTSLASIQRPGLRPFFDQSKSQTTLNQSSLTNEEAKQLSYAVAQALRENHTSQEENSDELYHDENSDSKLLTSEKQGNVSVLPVSKGVENGDKHDSLKDLGMEVENESSIGNQLSGLLGNEEKLPDYILMVSAKDQLTQNIAKKLKARLGSVLTTNSSVDVQSVISSIGSKLQKFCNRHSVSPPPLRVGVFGPEGFLRNVLKSYVEQFSNKTPDYQHYVKFLIIPLGHNKVASFLANIDTTYASLFSDAFWKSVFTQSFISDTDSREIEKRISEYLENGEMTYPLPIAEALITAKTGENANSSQVFVPFITELRMGTTEFPNNADADSDSTITNKDTPLHTGERQSSTLSSSPRGESGESRSNSTSQPNENLDLMVDYWPFNSLLQGKKEDKKEVNKLSIKSTFRSFSVSRLPENEEAAGLMFCAQLKNRKRVKRLMKQKADKDSESISTMVNKIVCTARNSGHTFNVSVDGKEWSNVKFFSLSHQWPTHIKQFPVGIFMIYDPT